MTGPITQCEAESGRFGLNVHAQAELASGGSGLRSEAAHHRSGTGLP
jgi:hypothetical protein